MKYSLNEILAHRLNGWKAAEWVYLNTLTVDLPFLNEYTIIEKSSDYTGLHGMSLIIMCSKSNPTEAYAIADSAIRAGVLNLGLWVIEYPAIAELVCHNHRFQTPQKMPISAEWQQSVIELSEAVK